MLFIIVLTGCGCFSFCVLQSCEICQEAFEMYWEEEEEEWHLRDALRVEGKVRPALRSLSDR